MKIKKSILGITGEYYVAAELGKRNVYAQLTLGNQKKTDLLIFSEETNKLLKIEVKCKQGSEWPNCKGILLSDTFIVFVDFKDISETERPTFYILSTKDWSNLIKKKKKEYEIKNPDSNISIEDNVLIFNDQKNKAGKPYKGIGVKKEDIEPYKENWDKILDALNVSYD
ncbi:MAG: hypothetical protein R6U04_06225 [Bacteroidales bacterium]